MNSFVLAVALLPGPGQGYLAPLEIALVAPKTRILAGEPLLAMPTPGPYRVMLQYGNSESIVSSNVVSINARAPIARHLELFERHIRPFPLLVSGHAGQFVERIDRLIDDYSPTPYLARSYVLVMRNKIVRAIQEAPDGYPIQGEVPALLEKLAKGTLGNNAFDEERLIVLAEMYERSGRREEAFATLREIVQRYPDER